MLKLEGVEEAGAIAIVAELRLWARAVDLGLPLGGIMYSDKIKLVKETFYKQAIYILIVVASIIVIGFFVCMKYENGLHQFCTLFATLNPITFCCLIAIGWAGSYYFRYRKSLRDRERFLQYGTRYPAQIVEHVAVIDWFAPGRTHRIKLIIRYDVDKEFITPAYDNDPCYIIAGNDCNVYVLDGKCYASDFYVERKRKTDIERLSRVNAEEYLYKNIDFTNFDRAKFIEGRVTILLDTSNKYIMPVPRPVLFNDGVGKQVVVDIAIESVKKVKVFTNFDDELSAYIMSEGKKYSSAEIEKFNEALKVKLKELLRTYYYFVKIISIDVGEF